MNDSEDNEYSFLKSALTLDNPFMPTDDLLGWLQDKKEEVKHKVSLIKFSEMDDWSFDRQTGDLVHDSGRFFSIIGVEVNTNWGNVHKWSQPIINQPEIGILGIITKKIDDVLYFLMQAKFEPGNINEVQLSPTLQATKSNYTQAHKGSKPHYLEYFLDKKDDAKTLLDQRQSEQGARVLKKRNRNMIIEVSSDIEVKEDFCWLTLGQIKHFLTFDNVVNMDTRTVISGITFGDLKTLQKLDTTDQGDFEKSLLVSELDKSNSLNSIENIIYWLTDLKTKYELDVAKIPLKNIPDWTKSDTSIYHKDHKYFSVIAVSAEISNREVQKWTQPMIKSAQEGVIAFIIKKINGVYHFLVQAKLECGNLDIIELAPTVQCLTGNYRKGKNDYDVEFIDYVLSPKSKNAKVRFSTLQSEEGGRFYKEQNKNMLIEVGDDFNEDVPDKYMWMTLNQLKQFIKLSNHLNVQTRSVLSAIRFI